MSLERQTTFGWLVSADTFLGGTGAGVFLVSFMLDVLREYEPMAKVGAVLGPALVFVGGLLLIAHLGSKTKLYKLPSNPSSWMSRGTWIMAFFIIFGLGYSLPSLNLFAWLPWSKGTTSGEIIGAVAAVASVLMLTYTGLLLAVGKRVPFWSTPALPFLFLFSGLSTGIACLLLMAPLYQASIGQEIVPALRRLVIAEVILVLMQLVGLGIYLEIAKHGGVSSVESIRSLKRPVFFGGVIIIGLIIPLCLLFCGAVASDIFVLTSLAGAAGILLLVGGILLRYSIIRAGVYLRLYSI